MHTISRIYIGNYGWNSAWYDGVIFDFRDRISNAPTDAIITLENGGGKTTLLSAIFSCFDTKKDRFLKTLHEARNKMSDYFSSDGLPAFILVEWQRVDPVSKKETCFVTGQCVAVKSAIDRNELERHFFSFECGGDLALESVPAPKLSTESAKSLNEVQTWLHKMRTSYKGNFFETKNQTDWERHLEAERGIDVHLLKLQVDFSKQEGGIDAAFLTFKNEQEFLRKFLQLTIDERRADDVRQTVASACDKLERKPEFQDRLSALLLVQEKMLAFSVDAQQVTSLRLSLEQLNEELRSAFFTALKLADVSLISMQEKQSESESLTKQASDLATRQIEYKTRWIDLEKLVRYRNCMAAKQRRDECETLLKQFSTQLKLLEAAKTLSGIHQIEEEISRLEKQTESARKGLQSFEQDARFHGALLRAALLQTEVDLKSSVNRIANEIVEETHAREENLRTTTQITAMEMQKSADLQVARHEQIRYEQDVAAFVEKGWLQDADEQASDALVRAQSLSQEQLDEAKNCKITLDELEDSLKSTTKRLETIRKNEILVAQQLDQQQGFLQRAHDERDRFAHDAMLCEILYAEVADPDHPDVVEQVEQELRKIQSSVERYSIQASELEHEELSVSQTGLAGRTDDVEAVLDFLSEAGVSSALAFNRYLAKIEPDGKRAGDILASNPARYLGVAIQKASELARAKEILQKPPKLIKPVWVTLAGDECDAIEDGFVVPPRDNSLVNFDEARAFAAEIAIQRRKIESVKASLKDRISNCGELANALKQYIREYGEKARLEAQAASARLIGELDDMKNDVQRHEDQIAQLANSIETTRQREKSANERVIDLRHRIEQLEDFQRRYPDTGERNRLIDLLASEVSQLNAHRERLSREARVRDEKLTRLRLEQQSIDGALERNEEERQSILHVDASVDAEQHLRLSPKSLHVLRQLYKQASDLLDREERNRLGYIKERRSLLENQLIEQRKEFGKASKGLDATSINAYVGANFDIERARKTHQIEECQASVTFAASDEAVARNVHDEFVAAYPSAKDLSDQFADVDTENLQEMVTKFKDLETESAEEALKARHAAAEAKRLADEIKGIHKSAQTISNNLRGMVLNELPCPPDELLLNDVERLTETATRLISSHTGLHKLMTSARSAAERSYLVLHNAVTSRLITLEPEVAHDLVKNELDLACENIDRLQTLLNDRIKTLQDMLDALKADFDLAVEELHGLVIEGINMLARACKKLVPEGVRYIGGKPILRMTSNLSGTPAETRRQGISDHLDEVIRSGRPAKLGTDLVADAIQRISGKPLGIRFLKMTVDPAEQYAAVDRISNSGGEGVVMAMFLYCVIAQLRSEMQADTRKAGGGPLILDNPFAKATTPTLWTGQRLLAREMGVQLLFATALSDYNTLGEFEHIFRLRKAGQNTKTGRFHIELVDYQLIKNG